MKVQRLLHEVHDALLRDAADDLVGLETRGREHERQRLRSGQDDLRLRAPLGQQRDVDEHDVRSPAREMPRSVRSRVAQRGAEAALLEQSLGVRCPRRRVVHDHDAQATGESRPQRGERGDALQRHRPAWWGG